MTDGDVPDGALQDVLDSATLILPLTGVINLDQEKSRLEKEISKLDADIRKYDGKLSNEGFLAKAPKAVIEEQKSRRQEAVQARGQVIKALARLT